MTGENDDDGENALGFFGRWLGRAIWLAMILACVAFWWLIISSLAPGKTVENDGGGVLAEYEARAAELDRSGELVRVVGICASACTIYLGLRNICTTPEARWGFHSPAANPNTGLVMLRRDWVRATERMARAYPASIGRWFLDEARHSSSMIWVSGAELIRHGVKECAA